MYRGQLGQWAWLLHRVSGVAVALFLYVHVLDTALVGFGPNVYNTVVHIYEQPGVRLLELLLVGGVLYHGGNGIRIIAIDFIPGAIQYNRQMILSGVALFVVIMVGVTYVMLKPFFFA